MYTASSVKKALAASKKLRLIGIDALGCPNDDAILTDGKKCGGNSKVCPAASVRYYCKQQVYVYIKEIKVLYTILNIYFPVSGTNTDGYIHENNSELGKLIDNGFMDRNILKTVQM